jgi:predicted small lipoprotein YifL
MMLRIGACLVLFWLVVSIAGCGSGGGVMAPPPRNPFGVPDVPNPDGSDVQQYAAQVTLTGDAQDPNAEPWSPYPSNGVSGSPLDGQWFGRWSSSDGTNWIMGDSARIRTVGERDTSCTKKGAASGSLTRSARGIA